MLIYIVFILTVFLFSLGQLGRISFFNQQINFYLYEVFLVINFGLLLIKYKLAPLHKFFIKNRWALIFVLILLGTYVFNLYNFSWPQNLVALLYLLRLIVYPIYFIYLNQYFQQNRKSRSFLSFAFGYLLVSSLIIGFTQYFLYPNLRNLKYLGWDEHYYRMFGQFLDTSTSGAIYGLLFIAVLTSKKFNRIKVFLLPLTFSAILLTFSRLSFIALIITCLIFFVKNKLFKYLVVFLLFFSLMVVLLPKPAGEGVNLLRTATLESRIKDNTAGFNYWLKSPLFGFGYNRIRYLQPQSEFNLHSGAAFSSSYLIILIGAGIFGLLIFLKLLFDLRKINFFSYYGIIFLGTVSLGDNVILHPLVIFVYGLLILFFISHR